MIPQFQKFSDTTKGGKGTRENVPGSFARHRNNSSWQSISVAKHELAGKGAEQRPRSVVDATELAGVDTALP